MAVAATTTTTMATTTGTNTTTTAAVIAAAAAGGGGGSGPTTDGGIGAGVAGIGLGGGGVGVVVGPKEITPSARTLATPPDVKFRTPSTNTGEKLVFVQEAIAAFLVVPPSSCPNLYPDITLT